MEIEDFILARRSCFTAGFDPERRLDRGQIESILEAARWAPTHKHTEPWRFRVYGPDTVADWLDLMRDHFIAVTPEHKKTTRKLEKFEKRKSQVSHVVLIIMQRDPQERVPEIEEICATACAAQNVYLSMKKHGVAGYWSTGMVWSPGFSERISLNPGEYCLGYFYLGVRKEGWPDTDRERKTLTEITEWV